MIDKDSLPLDKPRRTPDHPTKSHVVKTRVDGKEKIIRFGEQGASTAGKPKEGESDRMKQKRASFKARHAKNIAKGKSSPAYWANKVKWKTGGAVGLEELDEKYEGIKKPDFSLLESFQDLIRTLQSKSADAGTQEFDPLRALGRSGAAGSLEDLYEAYSDEPRPHSARAEAGGNANPDRAKSARMVFDSFKAAGFSDAQARALTAEINRENVFNPVHLFGTHTDAANRATNVGMLSWQGDRADRLMSFMADRGLIDPAGRIVPGQDALNAQAEYLRWEMENDPSYARTRETFLSNPEIDPETAHDILGKNFIRWRIDDPKYRGSGFDRISEGYDILNMAQGYKEGGKVEKDELAEAERLRDLQLMAEERNPNAVPAVKPGMLDLPGGVVDRLALINKYLNPVEAIGEAMRAGSRLTSADASGYDRLAALGDMLSGVAGVAGPAAAAKRVGAPAAAAVMEGLTGASPTSEAAKLGVMNFAADESGAFGGILARNADMQKFELAKSMSASGASRDEIWDATGWFKMPDGKWRFEIPDQNVNFRPVGEADRMASDMLKRAQEIRQSIRQRNEDLKTQPDLFPQTIRELNSKQTREASNLINEVESNYGPTWDPSTLGQRATYALTDSELQGAYPNLMRNTVVRTNQQLGGPYGSYSEAPSQLNVAPIEYIKAAKDKRYEDPRGVLLHELQHAIQGYEDFARGSSTQEAFNLLRDQRDKAIKAARDEYSDLYVSSPPELQSTLKLYEGARHLGLLDEMVDLERKAFDMGGENLIKASNRVDAEANRIITKKDAFDAYERHLGELEARLVAARGNWTPEQRKATPPWKMPEYIPEEDVIVKYAEGGLAGLSKKYDPDAIEARASKAGKNEFAAGGAVKYDPSAVDRIINQLREVNRG